MSEMINRHSGILYLCATPIGNLGDISERAVRTLKEVDLIACEDTRDSGKLLKAYDIQTPMTSYHQHNKYKKGEVLITQLLEGKNIALISDAGTPAISDPGEELVKECNQWGIKVIAIPGPTALITALTLSGLSTRRFVFEGFLPSDKRERFEVLEELKKETRTIILYEAPHRLKATLKLLDGVLSNPRITLCRELTKIYEEAVSMSLSDAVEYCDSKQPRGEYVIVIEGRSIEDIRQEGVEFWSGISIEEHMLKYEDQGYKRMEAMKLVAKDRGMIKRDIYDILNKRD